MNLASCPRLAWQIDCNGDAKPRPIPITVCKLVYDSLMTNLPPEKERPHERKT